MKSLLAVIFLCSQYIRAFSGDVSEGTWNKPTTFPASSRNFGLGFSVGGKGYFGMGQKQTKPFVYKSYNDLWEYDVEKNLWTQKADFPGPGRLMARGFSINNKIYVGFGYVIAASGPNAGGNDYQTDFYEFDPETNKWIKKNDCYLGRGDLFFVIQDQLYSMNPEFRALNRYSTTTDTWFETKWEKENPAPNYAHINGVDINFSIDKKEYLITALRKKNKYTNQLWELDPNSLIWKQRNDLPLPGNDTIHAFSIGEKKYVVRGGKELLEYNPAADQWVTKKEISDLHKNFIPVFSIGEKVYGFCKYEFWEFRP